MSLRIIGKCDTCEYHVDGGDAMPTLHVRNVRKGFTGRLQQRAEARSRSLSAEVVIILDEALR